MRALLCPCASAQAMPKSKAMPMSQSGGLHQKRDQIHNAQPVAPKTRPNAQTRRPHGAGIGAMFYTPCM